MEDIYCTKCINKKRQPGICFDENGTCHICNGEIDLHEKEEHIAEYERDFKRYLVAPSRGNGSYECMLMLSGGKDSIYMLLQVINAHKKKVLAFTYDHPYESTNAEKNIKKVCAAMDVDHISLSSHSKYRAFMSQSLYKYQKYNTLSQKAMVENPAFFMREKQPCGICTSYILLSAFMTAFRMNIPYILYCADPDQLDWIWVHDDIKRTIRNNKQFLGNDFYSNIFGDITEIILETDDAKLPKIIYPYVSMRETYDSEKIISLLKEKKLYNSNIFETHCVLWGFINYYAYKNFNTFLYASERAKLVREGSLSREKEIESEKKLREIFLHIAPKENISDSEKSFVIETLRNLEQVPESSVEYLYEMIINTRQYAEDLGFPINQ